MDSLLKLLAVVALAGCVSATMDFYEGSVQGFYVCRDPFGCIVVFQPSAPTPLVNATPTPKILFYEGSVENFLICRDPYTCQPTNLRAQTSSCSYTVNITWPLNGSTYYFPSITPDLNYTLDGATSPVCEYRINMGGWNTVACADGNNTFGPVTMPEGYPVILTVRVNDTGCSVTDSIEITVYYKAGAASENLEYWIIGLMLLAGAYIIFSDDDDKPALPK